MAYTKQNWVTGETITADKLNHIEDGIAATTGGAPLESTTYAELIAKRNSGTLTPGMQYRITDYVCTTTQEESRAVSHPFDIIVVADDESTLNENARACLHEGDNYYSAEGHQANLEAWEVKYCIDNDTNRFAWADTENGKGVIFYLKDERGNECPYDFKQIQFKRYKITGCTINSLIGMYTIFMHTEAISTIDENNPVWCYTFSVYDPDAAEAVFEDASIKPMDENTGCIVHGNSINTDLEEGTSEFIYHLNNNVFVNTFGNYCHSNTFGVNCYSNTFGGNCYSNTFGDFCNSNTFGNDCNSNTFENSCGYNVFGYECVENTFGKGCAYNTFGAACNSNTFGKGCYHNTFGAACSYNTFRDKCEYIDLSAGSLPTMKQYYHVLDGTKGTSISRIPITGTNGNNYVTYVGKSINGTLKAWVPADLAQ